MFPNNNFAVDRNWLGVLFRTSSQKPRENFLASLRLRCGLSKMKVAMLVLVTWKHHSSLWCWWRHSTCHFHPEKSIVNTTHTRTYLLFSDSLITIVWQVRRSHRRPQLLFHLDDLLTKLLHLNLVLLDLSDSLLELRTLISNRFIKIVQFFEKRFGGLSHTRVSTDSGPEV